MVVPFLPEYLQIPSAFEKPKHKAASRPLKEPADDVDKKWHHLATRILQSKILSWWDRYENEEQSV